MSTTTVRITGQLHAVLKQLAAAEGEPMQEVLARALESYRRTRFIERANMAYAALRSDPEAWQEEMEERRAWDATMRDDLREK